MKYISILCVSILLFSCEGKITSKKDVATVKNMASKVEVKASLTSETNNAKVTFIELGSVRCIPCQKMQGVIKSVNKKYGKQVKTIFYDVWTKEGKPYAETYKINLIPTQVFLDSEGIEYYRHEGFFPEEELEKILKQKGVK
ncbi:MAG: thioredoxin family protein [Lutibacter sp.]|uniref:TlpA family protein disulfide reductase n=1 Tax=Lutibacter sp. TaxID=1925666 RepID=UPI003859AB59